MFEKIFYISCEVMETGQLVQVAMDILEGSGNVSDIIGNSLSFYEGFGGIVFQNSYRFWGAITVFLLWLAALIRVIKDASARSSSIWFQLLSIFLVIGFTPVFGIILYIAIRPQGWKWDKTGWRNTLFENVQICENCGEFNCIDNLYCTYCGESLHTTCRECQKKYPESYSYCPNCGAPRI